MFDAGTALSGFASLNALTSAGGQGIPSPLSMVTRVRDLVYLRISEETVMVIACDSNASVGNKPNDQLAFSPRATGRSIASVALMEALAVGATPVVVIDNLCVEMDPTGREILAGVEDAVGLLDEPAVITGSDETNMLTTQTGVGMTVLAVAQWRDLLIGRCEPGDLVVCIGIEVGGPTHLYDDDEALGFAGVDTVQQALSARVAHEILPVGSKGIGFELGQLASASGLSVTMVRPLPVDVAASAGASTCILVATRPADLEQLISSVARRAFVIATFDEPAG